MSPAARIATLIPTASSPTSRSAICSSAGSSLKFCLVAAGEADLYPRFGRTMEWDTAAGHAVLTAAGGVVQTEEGKPLTYGKVEQGYDNPAFVAASAAAIIPSLTK